MGMTYDVRAYTEEELKKALDKYDHPSPEMEGTIDEALEVMESHCFGTDMTFDRERFVGLME